MSESATGGAVTPSAVRPDGDASALAAALAALGLPCTVEARAGLALLSVAPASLPRFTDAATRRDLLAMAATHGFTHLAVELADERHSDAPALRAAVRRD